ncbi:lysophosphatidic acid receptor 4-like [Pomacea canaliculata]|uniref:lysophosphatidic acid receptor 4-like n=1 Tax=Pomacea canaliculata TaxID=400727 RepID=UPI000D72E7E8|nr:lysophosphatidic acid receptor 4-like [Pomacea canaliculata]
MAGICFPVESKYHTAVLAVSRAQSICFLSAEKERKMNALQENDSVNATTDNYTTADHDNSSVLLFMKEDFEIAIAVPVSFLGIVCNLVSLTVWNTHTKYSASIFLFKYLAVWDTTFLVSYICKTLLNSFNFYYELTVVLEFFIGISKLLSVHTTLQIAVCRWLAVSRPLQVHNGSLLARRQIICVCVAVFIWCLCIANLHRVLDYLSQSELHLIVYKVIIIAIVGFIVPILLLVVFNVLLLRKTRSPSKLTASSAQQRRLQGSNPRVTLVVVLMSLFSVLSQSLTTHTMKLYREIEMTHQHSHGDDEVTVYGDDTRDDEVTVYSDTRDDEVTVYSDTRDDEVTVYSDTRDDEVTVYSDTRDDEVTVYSDTRDDEVTVYSDTRDDEVTVYGDDTRDDEVTS